MKIISKILFSLAIVSTTLTAYTNLGTAEFRMFNKKHIQIKPIQLNSKVNIHIVGMSAKVTITQEYKNPSEFWVEGSYLLPLPDNAAIDAFAIETKDAITQGIIKEKKEAKRIYKEAKAKGKKTAIIEAERDDLFTTKVANIAPKSTILVRISYIQPIAFTHEEFSIYLPNTLTPRYTPQNLNQKQTISNQGWANKNALKPEFKTQDSDQKSHMITITASIDNAYDIEDITSSSHQINWKKTKLAYEITLQNGKVPMNKDFHLSWKNKAQSTPTAALFSQVKDNDQYVSLMLLPPQIQATNKVLPREIIFVIDSSGSMQGVAMRQAKASLLKALQYLTPKDRFNIIEFDSDMYTLFDVAVSVSPESISKAKRFIANMVADGGTEIKPAIDESLKHNTPKGYLKQVIFLTDGSISNEEELLTNIKTNLGNARLFTIAIGSAPNVYFMRKSAEYGRGTFTHISDTQNITTKISNLFKQLKNPMLRDISIEFVGDTKAQYFPHPIPDLYLGEPLVVHAKTLKTTDKIIVKGKLLDKSWSQEISYTNTTNAKGIDKLWAKDKITTLLDQQILGVDEETIKAQVLPIALKHSLATKYTSFVAVEKKRKRMRNKDLHSQKIANLTPNGNTMFEAPYPDTATNSKLYILLGFVFFILGLLLYKKDEQIS